MTNTDDSSYGGCSQSWQLLLALLYATLELVDLCKGSKCNRGSFFFKSNIFRFQVAYFPWINHLGFHDFMKPTCSWKACIRECLSFSFSSSCECSRRSSPLSLLFSPCRPCRDSTSLWTPACVPASLLDSPGGTLNKQNTISFWIITITASYHMEPGARWGINTKQPPKTHLLFISNLSGFLNTFLINDTFCWMTTTFIH